MGDLADDLSVRFTRSFRQKEIAVKTPAWWHSLDWRRATGLALGALCLLAAPGCNVIGIFGALEESRRRNSTHTIQPEYSGLKDHQWAVVVVADRYIQGDYPQIVPYLTTKITDQLTAPKAQEKIGAKGFIPGPSLLNYLYEHPRWAAMPRSALAKELGVDRLIVVELLEYRLNEPGNQYLWNGEATGTIGVCEIDGPAPDEFSFQRPIKIAFPDKNGYGPNEMPSQAVATELARRFTDRCSWLFYAHEEPYYPKY